jgi:fatty acid desaturase
LIWKTKVGTVFSTPFEWINELECSIFFLVGFSVFSVFTQVPPCIDRCLKACDQKGIPRMTALKNLVPFVGLCFVTTLWAFAPSSTLIPNNTVLILLAAGLACGRINVFSI